MTSLTKENDHSRRYAFSNFNFLFQLRYQFTCIGLNFNLLSNQWVSVVGNFDFNLLFWPFETTGISIYFFEHKVSVYLRDHGDFNLLFAITRFQFTFLTTRFQFTFRDHGDLNLLFAIMRFQFTFFTRFTFNFKNPFFRDFNFLWFTCTISVSFWISISLLRFQFPFQVFNFHFEILISLSSFQFPFWDFNFPFKFHFFLKFQFPFWDFNFPFQFSISLLKFQFPFCDLNWNLIVGKSNLKFNKFNLEQ